MEWMSGCARSILISRDTGRDDKIRRDTAPLARVRLSEPLGPSQYYDYYQRRIWRTEIAMMR